MNQKSLKYNIAHINTHDIIGGAAKVAWRLINVQNNLGHISKILSVIKKSPSDLSEKINTEPDLQLQKDFQQKGFLYYEYQGSHGLVNHHTVKKADILHLHNLHGSYFNPFSLMLLAREKPIIWTLHDMQALTGHCAHSFDCGKWETGCGNCPSLEIYPDIVTDSTQRLLTDKEFIYENSAFTLTVPSRWLKNKIEKSILKNHRCELIYNGVDTDVFKPFDKAALRAKYKIPTDTFIVGGVANSGALSNSWKGGNYSLEALEKIFAAVPNSIFFNVGSGTNSNIPRVVDIAAISDEASLAEIYSLMDVFLGTSIADNSPLVVLEALACGVPVVSFKTGGIPELVVTGKTGLITEYKNSTEVAKAVISLANDKTKLKQFSNAAREDALKRFDIKLITDQYLKLYEESIRNFEPDKTSIPIEKIPQEIKTDEFMKNYHSVMNEKPHDVSIILATKDRANLLEEMLVSLQKAAKKIRYEIVVINGNQDNETINQLKKYGVTKIINEKEELGEGKHSWPKLYNCGFKHASGKWAVYASDDILFEENSLDNAIEFLDKCDDKVAGGAFFYKNVIAKNEWNEFGIDFTFGQNLLINYGLIRLDLFQTVSGFDEEYKFYCADGDLCLKLIAGGYKIVPLPYSKVIHNNVLDASKKVNSQDADRDINYYRNKWSSFCSTEIPNPRRIMMDAFSALYERELSLMNSSKIDNMSTENKKIRLHLGCGEKYIEGYINIDYPPSEHTVMKIRPDVYADITKLEYPAGSVDEIRLHHVFEHFNRVTALALLMKWHAWLKIGGKLHIETPDVVGCAKILTSNASLKIKMGIVRHLAGDQAAHWAYHIDQWFDERYEKTLKAFGFGNIQIKNWNWNREPYLANVEVIAEKQVSLSPEILLDNADVLLWDSTVADAERPTYLVWKEQLRKAIKGEDIYDQANNSNLTLNTVTPERVNGTIKVTLPKLNGDLNTDEVYDFNQRNRDRWVIQKASEIAPNSSVLDVGAGTCPYRSLFSHCKYMTHDFKKYEGEKLGKTKDYGTIDIESDIVSIPLADNSMDVILCTEVLEHVPEPIRALQEMARILKPGGKLLITAPLGSGLHQLPYHYYGGYTPEWYRHFGDKFNLDTVKIIPNGGFFKLLSQESVRAFSTIAKHQHLHDEYLESFKLLFGEWIPQYLFQLENECMIDQFTVGYHVEFKKKNTSSLKNRSENKKENLSSTNNKKAVNPSKQNKASKDLGVKSVIFSKNRALQLDAVLKSFYLNCTDPENVEMSVIYTADNDYLHQYKSLEKEFSKINFIHEKNFKNQLIDAVKDSKHILFLVDDNVFVREFSISKLVNKFDQVQGAIGFSLRLGMNTTYCYPKNSTQSLPAFTDTGDGILSFNWTNAQLDFNYPLEVSSSIYKTDEILPVVLKGEYKNPNTLEGVLDSVKDFYREQRPILLCAKQSISFCVPANKVQSEVQNRAGSDGANSVEILAELFDKGKRIDIKKLKGFVPSACHQELKFEFIGDKSVKSKNSNKKTNEIPVSIYTAAYNSEKYIAMAIDSVLRQSFENFEYIIVDDGSTDKTAEIVESYSDKRIKFFKREHQNFAAAMNFAIKNSAGKYIVGVDSDDYIGTDYIKNMYQFALQYPEADYIYPEKFTMINAQNNLTGEVSRYDDFSGDKNMILCRRLFNEATGRVPNPGSLKKKSLYDRLGYYEELNNIEDFVFLCKNCLEINFQIAKGIDSYFYRTLPSGNSNRYSDRSKIMADTLFSMASNYPPELFSAEFSGIDSSLLKTRYLSYIKDVFKKHSEFYKGRGGEYFKMYSDQVEIELAKLSEMTETA